MESLRTSLQNLVRQIRLDVHEWREPGKLVMARQGFVLRPNLSLHYTRDPNRTFEGITEHGEEEVWDWKDLAHFLELKVEPSKEYKQSLSEVSANQSANQLLRNFCWRIANDSRSPGSELKIDEHLDVLIRDLNESQEFVARMWLTGILLQEPFIQVSDSLCFREPNQEDLRERVLETHVHTWHAFQRETRFSCIAELRVSKGLPWGAQKDAELLERALRLFRLGAVCAPRIDFSSKSFSNLGNFQIGAPLSGASARDEYTLTQSDASDLAHFLKDIAPTLPTTHTDLNPQSDFLSTAFDWYSDALLSVRPMEGRIASAVACLEALFLDDNAEITYKLGQRVATLLGRCGWPSLQIQEQLTVAYKVRSRYVHGSLLDRNKWPPNKLAELFRMTADYARLGFLVASQLLKIHDKKKADLLKLVDRAMVDDLAREQLNNWCKMVAFVHYIPAEPLVATAEA